MQMEFAAAGALLRGEEDGVDKYEEKSAEVKQAEAVEQAWRQQGISPPKQETKVSIQVGSVPTEGNDSGAFGLVVNNLPS